MTRATVCRRVGWHPGFRLKPVGALAALLLASCASPCPPAVPVRSEAAVRAEVYERVRDFAWERLDNSGIGDYETWSYVASWAKGRAAFWQSQVPR